VSAFAESVKVRAVRQGYTIAPDITLSLSLNGFRFVLDPDDILADVVDAAETIDVTFGGGGVHGPGDITVSFTYFMLKVGTNIAVYHACQSTEEAKLKLRQFQIRVITPALAKNPASIPLLANGEYVTDNTTLRQVKELIARHLEFSGDITTGQQCTLECNCSLARTIYHRGEWYSHGCYRAQWEDDHLGPCALCGESLLAHPCEDTAPGGCTEEIFVRTDTSCGHSLHSACLRGGRTWNCPNICALSKSILSYTLCAWE
jgi:hypothetical protein